VSVTTSRATRSLLDESDRGALAGIFGTRARFDEGLAPYTSWKIGGPADALVTVQDANELAELLRFCLRRRLAWWIIGAGSNVLVGDGGIRGIVIRLGGDFASARVRVENGRVIVEAGGSADMALVTAKAASAGAEGIGSLAGIHRTA
jgi:UDP-N-acetylmuramate dehydrogenase